jgi:ABC-2 type transport system ATP-binding protein
MGEKDIVLKLRSVSKSFNKQEVLKDISIDIKRGEIFGIIGSSGSGKTTILNAITGNIFPDKGKIFFEPKAYTKFDQKEEYLEPLHLNPYMLKKSISYSPQTPSVYDKLTCTENLDLFATLHKIPYDIKKVNINILLDLVGLKEAKKKKAEELSGGMKKRLDLACSLVHDPKILVLDEPTADLDLILRKQMWNLIKKINSKGTTIIMSSHFLEEIKGLCDRIGILNHGKLEFIGSPKEIKKRKESALIIKIETAEKNYKPIENKINSIYNKKVVFNTSDILEIKINNVINHSFEAHKIFTIANNSKQKVLEFNYTKEGIAELFESVQKKQEEPKKEIEIVKKKTKKWKL